MAVAIRDAWSIVEQDFPAQGSRSDQLKFLLNYAVLAPSGRNTQPWLFNVLGDQVELFCDRTRARPVADPLDREMIISCGGVLANLRIALLHFGIESQVELLPDARLPDLVARVRATGKPRDVDEPAADAELFSAILRRRTYRLPFEPVEVDRDVVEHLRLEAHRAGTWLGLADGDLNRLALCDLIEEGDRILDHDRAFRDEVAYWLRDRAPDTSDGVPLHSLGHSDLAERFSPVVRFMVRNIDLGRSHGRRDRLLALGSPMLAVLCTPADQPLDWLIAGQALARILLRGRAAGLSASFFSQPLILPPLRERLTVLANNRTAANGHGEQPRAGGVPQVIVRMGYGHDIVPTPRRCADEMILHRAPESAPISPS